MASFFTSIEKDQIYLISSRFSEFVLFKLNVELIINVRIHILLFKQIIIKKLF